MEKRHWSPARRAESAGRSQWNWRARAPRSRSTTRAATPRPRKWRTRSPNSAARAMLGQGQPRPIPRRPGRWSSRSPRSSRHLDILVNNAGITRDKLLRKMTDEDWLEVIQTNLNAVLLLHLGRHPDHDRAELRADRQHQLDERPGRRPSARPTTAPARAASSPSPGRPPLELAKSGITVNAVSPGLHRDRHVRQGARRHCRPRSRPRSRWAASPSRRRSPRR